MFPVFVVFFRQISVFVFVFTVFWFCDVLRNLEKVAVDPIPEKLRSLDTFGCTPQVAQQEHVAKILPTSAWTAFAPTEREIYHESIYCIY